MVISSAAVVNSESEYERQNLLSSTSESPTLLLHVKPHLEDNLGMEIKQLNKSQSFETSSDLQITALTITR